ncbi:MAG TPA: carbohydrate-binding protein [Candidatus Methylacidiphilales bacterium]|nr:carbohydrate-binding protein [Candidatus Methylacidiphilales bacterium]
MTKRFIVLGVMLCFLSVRADDLSHFFDASNDNHVPADYKGKPYAGYPADIPGTIHAETYDIAPDATPGICFDKSDSKEAQPTTTKFRTTPDSIGIAAYRDDSINTENKAESKDQVFIGWTHVGQWFKYTVKVKESGDYIIGGKFAATTNSSALAFDFGPGVHTQPLPVPATTGVNESVSSFHTWELLDKMDTIHLDKGTYVMTVTIENQAGLNLGYFTFKKKE